MIKIHGSKFHADNFQVNRYIKVSILAYLKIVNVKLCLDHTLFYLIDEIYFINEKRLNVIDATPQKL